MEFKDILTKYLPKIADVVINPVGGGIGIVTSILGDIFGFDSKTATPEDIDKVISQDPQAVLKLRMAQMDFELKRKDQDIEEVRLQLQDVQSARSREVEVKKAGGTNIFMYALGAVICIGFFALTALLMFRDLPPGSSDTVKFLLTQLATAFLAIVYYLWGSSKGSSDKTEIFGQAIKK